VHARAEHPPELLVADQLSGQVQVLQGVVVLEVVRRTGDELAQLGVLPAQGQVLRGEGHRRRGAEHVQLALQAGALFCNFCELKIIFRQFLNKKHFLSFFFVLIINMNMNKINRTDLFLVADPKRNKLNLF
jgi:hypothetical protein